jgi:aldose 1-epimerase
MTIELLGGGWTATLSPEKGAAMTRLAFHDREVLMPVPPGVEPNDSQAGAFVMLPWANRLDGGRLPWAGVTHSLPVNRPKDGTAIHGLARDRPWTVETVSPSGATLTQAFAEPGTPFRYQARLVATLGPEGLELALAVTNTGDAPFPFGLGWHPWFSRPPGTRVRLAATHRLLADDRTLPVEAKPVTGLEIATDTELGLDAHHAGWGSEAVLTWPDGAGIRLRAEGALAHNLHVFIPGYTAAICLEPVSHVPDVINRRQFAALGDMAVLAPGESLAGMVAITVLGNELPEEALDPG